jgi:hypothetical protein
MATLSELARSDEGPLFKLDPGLDEDELENRLIYTSAKLKTWITDTLPALTPFYPDQTVTPLQQLTDLVATFASGVQLFIGNDFKPFSRQNPHPIGGGVWYLKTSDLRVFGWFPVKDCFVGVVADDYRVKIKDLYEGYRGEVIRFRQALPLDEPKFIDGVDPNGVLSNWHFP